MAKRRNFLADGKAKVALATTGRDGTMAELFDPVFRFVRT
jgi:hypothetical protein